MGRDPLSGMAMPAALVNTEAARFQIVTNTLASRPHAVIVVEARRCRSDGHILY